MRGICIASALLLLHLFAVGNANNIGAAAPSLKLRGLGLKNKTIPPGIEKKFLWVILEREAVAIRDATTTNKVDSDEVKAHAMEQAAILMGKAARVVENPTTIE
eukprot:GHVU01099995.1.p2 GENE.GHVU01099995.1~~GHVU01099995.1.p2  ORF type:complete len:104 (-),score=20.96 GHVU01099995.1:66-377(-)